VQPRPGATDAERLALYRLLDRCVVDQCGCWIWTGAVTSSGYGCVGSNGEVVLAHRLAWELQRGPIPAGLTIDHRCQRKLCLNAADMEPVPLEVNAARGVGHSPLYCKNGHPLFGALGHWVMRANGKRRCITCDRALLATPRQQKKTAARLERLSTWRQENRDAYNAQQRAQYARRAAAKTQSLDDALTPSIPPEAAP